MVLLALSAAPASAVITQVRATPPRTVVTALQGGQSFNVTWVVSTDPAHTLGAVSPAGEFYNASTGAIIAPPVGTTVGAPAGTGPLSFPETIALSDSQLAAWRAQGIRLVGFRRSFVAPGGPAIAAQWVLELRGAGLDTRATPGGALAVRRLDLTFAEGRRLAVIARGSELTAKVAIAYSGSGTLRGRWELAEPGGDSDAFFRVLAQVRESLGGGQVATFTSPQLPTAATGRYRLRFCVEEAGTVTAACADSAVAVEARYQVQPAADIPAIRGTTDNLVLGKDDSFRWQAVPGSTTCQLQIFLPATADQEPRFVAGILVPGASGEAALSPLVQRKLAVGAAYLWRVTAHDADGNLLARSELRRFVFRP
jgi:hypothetical protein